MGEQEDIATVIAEAEAAVDKVRSEQTDDDAGEAEAAEQPAPDAADVLAAQLVEAEAEAKALKDKWLRSVADLENYKKRVKRDIDDAVHRSVKNLLSSFLPVGDNLERALSVAPADAAETLGPFIKGIEMVRSEFFSALGKHDIKPVESVGKPFDPSYHEALQQVDSPDFAPGIVTMEYEKGYTRGGKLLRPARVIVAGPGSTGAPPADQSGDEEAN